jgi:hypothetical protein
MRPGMEAKPGTVIKMHGGVHAYDNQRYWDFTGEDTGKKGPTASYWQHGTITLNAKGTAEQPIYIVPAGDGEVILDGNGCHNLFNLRSTDYLHFEGLTIRGTDIAFHCGWQGLRGGGMKGLTVRNCWIEGVVYGILAQDGRSEDFLISDNVILGRGPQSHMGGFGRSETGYAVNLSGQGHTVSHNYVANFWDGINVFTGAHSDPQYGQQARSIDFTDNDIHNCADQFIEADGGYANLRMLRNRGFNCPSQPVSCQPVHAGPVYWVGNIIWRGCNGKETMKHQRFAQAYVFVNNTSSSHMTGLPNKKNDIKPEQSSWLIANNLCLGPKDKGISLRYPPGPADARHRSHNNAHQGGPGPWSVGSMQAKNLSELQEKSGHEQGSFLVGYEVLTSTDELAVNAKGKQFVMPESVDLRPAEGSPLVDAGIHFPGLNDGFTGAAPDIGALKAGVDTPTFGPRHGPYLERLAKHRAALAQAQQDEGE